METLGTSWVKSIFGGDKVYCAHRQPQAPLDKNKWERIVSLAHIAKENIQEPRGSKVGVASTY